MSTDNTQTTDTGSANAAPAGTSPETTTVTEVSAPAPTDDGGGASAAEGVSGSSSDGGHVSDGGREGASASDDAGASEAEGNEGDDEGAGSDVPTAEGSPAGDAPKKKRRRKRKKKPVVEGAPAEGEAVAEPGTAEGAATPAQRQPSQKKPQRPQRERRPSERPSTERAPFHVGEEVFGKVTGVLDTAIMIDLSGKALAIFDRLEMEADDLVPSVGDRFVARVHNDGARGGLVVLTRKPLREEEAKLRVQKALEDGTLVQGLVTGPIKGGVEVDIDGLRAFAPASGMDLHPSNANFIALVGQRLDFKVVQVKAQGRDVVITRRPMLEAEAHERRKHALSLLTEGQVLDGVVRTVVEWGAFVALPGAENLEGLVHISEASHDPRARLADLMKPGDRFEVKLVKIDEKGKLWLSRKALLEDPWAEAREKYAPGTKHRAKVVKVEKFGAFVELEPGLDGLIHVSELSMERVESAAEVVKLDQELEVVIANFDVRTRRVSLNLAPPPGRENEPQQKVVKYAALKVEVVKAEAAGLVVRVLGVHGRGARGFIPAGQTGTQRGTDLRKHFKQGTILDAKVIDLERNEPKLSIRGLAEDEEKRAHADYRKKLKAEGGFGTLGDLLAKRAGK